MAAHALKKRKLGHSAKNADDVDQAIFGADDSDASAHSERRHDQNGGGGEEEGTEPTQKRRWPNGGTGAIGQDGSSAWADYNSNLFKLQAEEMLRNVRPTHKKRMVKVDAALRRLKEIIERIPDQVPVTVAEAENQLTKKHKVGIPFSEPRPDKDVKYSLLYSKPANINVVGSYARKTLIQTKTQVTVDLAVTMPANIFQEKDYLNYRYFHKRAYYLARIAVGIRESKEAAFDLEYSYQNDNHLQPIIIVQPSANGGDFDFSRSKCEIRILLAADGAVFPMASTKPSKMCVRRRSDDDGMREACNAPTPFYNASLRSDCCSLGFLKLLHAASAQSAGFDDACVLGSVWLRQRGLGTGLRGGGFGPFEWACTLALLMQGGGPKDRPVLSKAYSSYQLFKATLQYLSMRNLVETPAFIRHEEIQVAEHEGPLLFDGLRGMNVLFKMSSWSYATLRHEANKTVKLLGDSHAEQFDGCFIAKLDDPMRRFDILTSFPLYCDARSPTAIDAFDMATKLRMKAYQVLKRGLDDRVLLVGLEPPSLPAWPIDSDKPRTSQTDTLLVGFLLNPEHINRSVDRGPSAEDKEAAASFRNFWGEKAELRRFKDGNILESLIWSTSDHSVLEQIIVFVLRRHLGDAAADGFTRLGASFDNILPSYGQDLVGPVALYQPTMTAYEDLEEQIRGLDSLPLHIRQVCEADSQLRYASLGEHDLKLDRKGRGQRVPAGIHVQFEGSARWPDHLGAAQRTKIAFLLKIGELLEKSSPITTCLGLENSGSDLMNIAFLDARVSTGECFHIRIHHKRELPLLERALKSKSYGREAIASALSAYKRNFVQSPLHTQAIRTLSTRFPVLSASMRLMKKWCNSHLLSSHISDELIELLTIRTFVQPYPWAVPGSAMTGFLRTLTFVSRWDWRSDPLIVDFNNDMKTNDVDAINVRFEAWRKIDPAMNRIAVFAASSLDPDGTTWTDGGPSKVVAARLTGLARAACRVTKEQGLNLEAAALFTPSLADYDFLIHVGQKFAEKSDGTGKKQSEFKNLQTAEDVKRRLPSFSPVLSFLQELKAMYGSDVIFFHDEKGGSIIGGLWNPQTRHKMWKINTGYSTLPIKPPSEEDPQITLNKAGTLHDIARLGGDMISKIETKK